MSDFVPYIQLGFAAVMALILVQLVKSNNASLLDQNGQMVANAQKMNEKIAATLENHLSSVARSLTLVEEKLSLNERRVESLIPLFMAASGNLEVIVKALVNSNIITQGTKATVEPASFANTKEALDEIAEQKAERVRVQERDRRIDEHAVRGEAGPQGRLVRES